MSILDGKLVFSDNQAPCVTDTETQTASSNTIDLGADRLALGAGTPLYVNVRVGVSFTGAATGGMSVAVQEGDNAGAACTGAILHRSRNFLLTALTKNAVMMKHAITAKKTARHLRLLYQITSAATGNTAGNVDAELGPASPETQVGT